MALAFALKSPKIWQQLSHYGLSDLPATARSKLYFPSFSFAFRTCLLYLSILKYLGILYILLYWGNNSKNWNNFIWCLV